MTAPRVRHTGSAALALLLIATLACGSATGGARSRAAQPVLEPREGATARGVVYPGQPHVFPLTIDAGTYFELHLDRDRTVLATHVLEPGVPLDAPPGDAYVSDEECPDPCGQRVWEVATAAGRHHLRLEAEGGGPVEYRLTVEALRAANDRDMSRHRGLRIYDEARTLRRDGRNEEALGSFLRARELFARGEYWRGVAATHSQCGTILRDAKRWQEGRAEYWKAIEYWQMGGDPGSAAGTLVSLAGLEFLSGHSDRATQHLDEALVLARESGQRLAEATALGEFCNLYVEHGRLEEATEVCQRALALQLELGRLTLAVTPLLRLASTYEFRGETEEARSYLLQAQALLEKQPNRQLQATVTNELARLLDREGDYLEALALYQEAREGFEAVGRADFAGVALSNMGTIHQRLGNLDATHEYYRQALALMRETPGSELEQVHVLLSLGWIHIQRGELATADEMLQEALEIARAWDRPPLVAACLERVGELHVAAGRPREAIAVLEQVLSSYRANGSRWREPFVLIQLSHARRALGEHDRALRHLFDAASLYEEIGRRWGVAESYYHMARLERDRGDLEAARRALEQALAITDSLRPQVGGTEFRTLVSATTRPYYELYVGILMDQHERRPAGGHDAEALRESERARARSLLEILPESDLDLGEKVPEELLAERASIRHRLDAKELERREVAESGSAEAGELFRLRLDLEALLTELQEIEREIRAASPRYAGLTRPPPVTVGEIQRSLLDQETALLEYFLGDERSFLWLVTEDEFRSYELPGRQEIEDAARCVHWLITAYGKPAEPERIGPEGTRCLGGELARYGDTAADLHVLRVRAHRRRVLREAFARTSAELSAVLLGPPARAGLLPFRLAVVPDGALEYVPFAALPSPEPGGDPLVAKHEVLRLPSASVLAFQRSQEPPGSAPPADGIAILADPVYGPADSRLATRVPEAGVRAGSPGGRRDGPRRVPDYSRLDFSGQEAEAIAALAPASRVAVLEGLDANRKAVQEGALAGFRYVHFATHGVIDTEYPQLSGLVLSLVGPTGEPDEGGFLRLHDIYGLDLDAADLVVLSACETALGREVRGEGLVGLTRGFLYAGAERVVASLWQVEDRATADLMERMYRGLLREGRSPADALRRAQLETRAAPGGGYEFPYYWAGFVLQGEWR